MKIVNYTFILVHNIRKNQSVSILKKIHESLKDDSGINKDVEEFIKKSEKLRNFKFL
jgi:hypothetical protein